MQWGGAFVAPRIGEQANQVPTEMVGTRQEKQEGQKLIMNEQSLFCLQSPAPLCSNYSSYFPSTYAITRWSIVVLSDRHIEARAPPAGPRRT
jgi:hypothetical protein